jgi:acetoin utilization deacetylase AcuC-like enzyme
MTAALGRVADKSAGGKIALLLEGGYDLSALEASLADSMAALVDGSREKAEMTAPAPSHEAEIDRTIRALRDRWPSLR